LNVPEIDKNFQEKIGDGFTKLMSNFELNEALEYINSMVNLLDKFLATITPWKLPDQEKTLILQTVEQKIREIAFVLAPFMPETAKKIQNHFNGSVKAFTEGLFPRLS